MRYRARRLPQLQGPAAWDAILPPRVPRPALEGAGVADVVVVGAGFAGLSATQRLLAHDPGLRVTVLEAGQIGQGGTGRNSGFMIDLPHELTSADYAGPGNDRAVIALNRKAQAFAAEAVAAYDIPRASFDRVGKVNGAAGAVADGHNTSYARHLDTLDEPYERLDAQAMTELTGSRHYVSGLYTPGTVMLQPAGYIRGLAEGLARHVAIHEHSPVMGFVRAGSGWRVKTPGGHITCAKVILAVNGHLESFGIARGRLMQVFLFASMTGALPPEAQARLGGAPRWGVTPSDPMGTTLRRIDDALGGHRIVTRTCAVLAPGMRPSAGSLRRAAAVHRRKFDARFPQLAGTPMEHVWSGHLCLSMNGVSVTGEIDTGLYSACVQNGLGTARGTLTGMGAADLVCGQASDITGYFTTEPKPSRLPPRPLREIGANAVMRWREWRARDE